MLLFVLFSCFACSVSAYDYVYVSCLNCVVFMVLCMSVLCTMFLCEVLCFFWMVSVF